MDEERLSSWSHHERNPYLDQTSFAPDVLPKHTTVHDPDGCIHCRMYAKHLEGEPLKGSQPSTKTYQDGIREGKRLQEEEDYRLLMQYREQLHRSQRRYEDSVLMQERFRHEFELMEAEVALLRDELMAVQMAYDDVTMYYGGNTEEGRVGGMSTTTPESEERQVENSVGDPEDPELGTSGTRREVQDEPHAWEPDAADYVVEGHHFAQILRQLRIEDETRMRAMGVGTDVDRYSIASDSEDEGHHSPISISSTSSMSPSRSGSVGPQLRLGGSVDILELTVEDVSFLLEAAQTRADDEAQEQINLLMEDAEQTPHALRTEAQLYLLRHGSPTLDNFCFSIHTVSPESPTQTDLTIDQVSSLMAAAAGRSEGRALSQVRQLIEEAERTPKSMRTPAQLYLLLYWRKPSRSSQPTSLIPSISASNRPSSSVAAPEIFVDASAFGVGFILNGRWLAWKFRKGHPDIQMGPDRKIVMSWAEIIAVELGIHALIAAGYRNTEIILRSDNYGVIKALARQTWTKNYGVEGILQRILALCRSVGLVVFPIWVSTHVNPADGPSRGLYPPAEMRFSYVPEVPRHLQRFLLQAGGP